MLINAISVSVLFFFFSPWIFATNRFPQSKPVDRTGPSTIRITTKGDELSIVFPVKPVVHRFNLDLELFSEERVATAYDDGVVYVLQLLKTRIPRYALRDYLKYKAKGDKSLDLVNRQELSVGGIVGTQEEARGKSRINGEQYYTKEQYFATKHHLYIISATTRDRVTPKMNDFFSSLKLGAAAILGPQEANNLAAEEPKPSGQVPFKGDVYDAKEVTRQALIVWQPPLEIPLFFAAVDMGHPVYEIQVQLILTPTGEVADLKAPPIRNPVLLALVTEMTEHVSFIPAELNGRPVAQRTTFKYELQPFKLRVVRTDHDIAADAQLAAFSR